MEHYVRTKDGIYEIKGANLIIKSFTIYKGKRQCFVKEKDILKQADTIEELCDEFVSVYKNLTPELLKPKFVSPREPLSVSWKNRLEEERLFKDTVVYGAIWTKKGLIYVAKMNTKGELELL